MRNVEMNPAEPDRINVEARMDISSDPIKVRWSFIRCDITVRANNKRVGVPLTLRADNPFAAWRSRSVTPSSRSTATT